MAVRSTTGYDGSLEMAWLNILIKSGLLGVLAYAFIFIRMFKLAVKANDKVISVGIMAITITLLASSLVEAYIQSIHCIYGMMSYMAVNGLYGCDLNLIVRSKKDRMINLLYIVGVWGNGGIEKVVYTYCKNLSPDKYNIYLLPIEKRESIFTAKLQEIGVTIIEPVEKINGNALQKYKSRKKIVCNAVKNKHFDIVHFHNSIFTSYMFLNEMKKICPNTKYILHSHGDNAEAPYVHIKRLLNNIIKTIYQNVPDFCTACSDNAGKWSFTKRILFIK